MPVEEIDAGLVPALLALVDPDERCDPMSPLRWTTKSLRHLAVEHVVLGLLDQVAKRGAYPSGS